MFKVWAVMDGKEEVAVIRNKKKAEAFATFYKLASKTEAVTLVKTEKTFSELGD